jgi:hypothetical protein
MHASIPRGRDQGNRLGPLSGSASRFRFARVAAAGSEPERAPHTRGGRGASGTAWPARVAVTTLPRARPAASACVVASWKRRPAARIEVVPHRKSRVTIDTMNSDGWPAAAPAGSGVKHVEPRPMFSVVERRDRVLRACPTRG